VLLVNQRASVTDMSLPSKLTSYFGAGRPIVAAASAESETAREIDTAGAGLTVPPDDPAAFAKAISLLKDDRGRAQKLGASGKRYAEAVLSPATVLTEHEAFLYSLLESDGGRQTRPRTRASVPS
jgi:glycosyltransferase involved in cell wall biosynthesis